MKNEFGEEVEMFFPGQFDYMLEQDEEPVPAPEQTSDEVEADDAEWRATELREIIRDLKDEGAMGDAEPHHLVILPYQIKGGAPRSELRFFAKDGLEGRTLAGAVKEIADVLTRALPEGEVWTIGQDLFTHEIGRIRVEGAAPERAHEFMMQTMVAYFESAA